MRRFAILAVFAATTLGCSAGPGAAARGGMTRTPAEAALAIAPPSPNAHVAALDPVVVAMPSGAETSIDAVGRYLAEREPDDRARVKAMHDWVADRIAYDDREGEIMITIAPMPGEGKLPSFFCAYAPRLCFDEYGLPPLFLAPALFDEVKTRGIAYDLPQIRDYLADRAFVRRRGVCANYAALLSRIGAAGGESIAVVVGKAGLPGGEVGGHAWNVARLGDRDESIDVTWDAGTFDDRGFQKNYSDKWLFAHGDEFAATHTPLPDYRTPPDHSRWLPSRP